MIKPYIIIMVSLIAIQCVVISQKLDTIITTLNQ
jgi:hypothetical protein